MLLGGGALLLLSACANMTGVSRHQTVRAPAPGKALVYFVRVAQGDTIPAMNEDRTYVAVVYNGREFVGALEQDTHVAYQANPGRHVFILPGSLGDKVDFLAAELTAGKTYFVKVGRWPRSAVFGFEPHNGQFALHTLHGWTTSTKQVAVSERGKRWADQKFASRVERILERDIRRWETLPDTKKQILRADSGR